MGTKVTVGDEIVMARRDVSWVTMAGESAYVGSFEVHENAARRLEIRAKSGETFTLLMAPDGLDPLEVNGLHLIRSTATNHENIREIHLADKRWLFARTYLERAYNIRRRTGERRLVREGDDPVELTQIVDDVHYQPWSLFPRENPADRWVARDVIQDVIDSLDPTDSVFSSSLDRQQAVEGLTISENGDSALSRAMALMPGASHFIDPETTGIFVYDTRDQSEDALISGASPPFRGPALSVISDRSYVRPGQMLVFFSREVELKFTSRTDAGSVVRDSRTMENVAPIPDFQLEVGGRTLPNGTYVTFDELIAAWAADPSPSQLAIPEIPAISHSMIREYWFIPGAFQEIVTATGIDPDPILASRIAAIQQHYHQTFRIDRRFLDRLAVVQDTRVGILDDEDGTRAKAVAYTDWTVLYPLRAGSGGLTGNPDDSRFSATFSGFNDTLADARVAPCDVSVVDSDQGIIRLDFKLDPYGQIADIHPGAAEGRPGLDVPYADAREEAAARRGSMAQELRLSDAFQCSVVLSVVPGAPNDERKMHIEVVEPAEAFALLGVNQAPECNGPTMDLRVGPHLETARIAWQDSAEEAFDDLLGLNNAVFGSVAGLPDLINPDRVHDLAVAYAASMYASMVDRREGQYNGPWSPGLLPTGSIAAVEHSIDTDGTASCKLHLPMSVDVEDPLALLPESLRRSILGLVKINTAMASVSP
jgi:hypothetical protein